METSKENDGPPVKDADQSSGDRADDQTDDQADDQADDQTNGNKWLSDHVAEVVYLATQVQLTKQTVDVFSQLQSDHPDAWKVSLCVGTSSNDLLRTFYNKKHHAKYTVNITY